MATVPTARADDAAAREALRELKRLATEALRRFEHDALIEAMSSLAAIPTVLNPLLSHVQQTWISSVVPSIDEGNEDQCGGYL